MVREFVPVPKDLKRYVIGRGGIVVKEIQAISGARVSQSRDMEGFIVSGSDEQRPCAKKLILEKVAGGRLKCEEMKVKTVCYYIDECNLRADCKLKLERVVQEVPRWQGQYKYRLKSGDVLEPQGAGSPSGDPSYLEKLKDVVLETLSKIKDQMKTKTCLKADMWCHFGTVLIEQPTEGIEGEWDIKEVVNKLQPAPGGNHWKAAFNGGVKVEERLIEHLVDKVPEEYDNYLSRYDLAFFTPSDQQLRVKVWVTKGNLGKKAEDIPTPSSDMKNILHQLHFKDELTRSRCQGWLVLPSRRYLQADILFPGSEFDCRITIRGQADTDYAPKEDTTNVLLEYLSELTFTDEDDFGLRLPKRDLPSGFNLSYVRCSKRALHGFTSEFSIILSKESSYRNDATTEESRMSTDFHLRCKEWDELLNSGNWEPDAIVKKFPEFFRFVKKIQSCVIHEMKETGLQTVPPVILARGSLALKAYNKALADGKTFVKRVPIMLIGQDGAGKTSLKKSLRGICFDPEEDSTVGINVDPSYFEVTTETWRTGTTEKDQNSDIAFSFDHHAAMFVADNLKREDDSTFYENGTEQFESIYDLEVTELPRKLRPTQPHGDAKLIEMPSESKVTLGGDTNNVPLRQSEQDQKNFDAFSTSVPEEVAVVTESLLQDGCEDSRKDVYSTLWDFAGQSVYYETHPLFLTKRAIYCLVYDLSLNLHDRAKHLVKQGLYKESQDSFNLKTNLDYLDFWMMSVASLVSNQSDDEDECPKSEVLPEKLPPVFLVCTHADKPYEDRDPTDLAREILGCLKRKPYGAHLHDVFVVDNTKSGTESECSEVMRLRQDVLAVAEDLPYINETIPIKWLQFEKTINALKENGKKCISLKEATDIASTVCKINEDVEIKTLIDYLHDLRSLIHFDDSPELNKLVVLDAQWLIDVFKMVITVKPYDCSEKKKRRKEKKFQDLWCKLEREGILDERLLADVWGTLYNSKESYESLIGIMDKFSLVCPWPSDASENKTYLVPSMLRTRPPTSATDLLASAEIPSLFIKFETGQVPAGLFPRLVLQLFQWGTEDFGSPEKPELFYNFARFFTSEDGNCSVILLCHSGSVEIVVHGVSASSSEDLSSKMTLLGHFEHETPGVSYACAVRRQLSLILEVMRNEFCWLKNMTYEMCVVCPVCCCGSAVNYCRTHHQEICKEEQCLHFLKLSELCRAKEVIICKRPGLAPNRRVHVMQFAPWLDPVEHQFRTGDGGYLSPGEANQGKALALPDNVVESLFSEECDSKMVVSQWKESLHLDQVSLEKPDDETKALIRCLARKANLSNRRDVVRHLRGISPAGTTGPVLPENLDVRGIPINIGTQLTIFLSGGDEWKPVAEKLGLNPDEIRYLDRRVMNPADALLAHIAKQRHLTVGEFYDVLSECGFPLVADRL